MQDSKGYIWISTNNGVVRYDGREMKVFTRKDGLTDNIIFQAYEDRMNRIWFRTYNSRLCYYKNDSIFTIGADDSIAATVKKRTITNLHVDENNRLWFTVHGLCNFYTVGPAGHYAKLVTIRNAPGLYCKIFNDGYYLFAHTSRNNSDTLNIHTPQSVKQRPFPVQLSSEYEDLAYFNDSVFFVSGQRAFGKTFLSYINGKKAHEALFSRRVIKLCKEGNNTLWVAVYKDGLFRYDLRDLSKPADHFMDGLSITSMIKDYEGGTWFSTLENGLYYKKNIEDKPLISDKPGDFTAFRFVKKLNGKLFLGTDSSSILMIDTGGRYSIVKTKEAGLLNDISFFDRHYYLGGYSYLDTYNEAFHLTRTINFIHDSTSANGRNSGFKQVKHLSKDKFLLGDGYYLSIVDHVECIKKFSMDARVDLFLVDSAASCIYIGTKAGMYTLKDFNNLKPEQVMFFKGEAIRKLCFSADHELIVVTQQKGIFVKRNTIYDTIFRNSNTLINDMDIDDDQNIWIATSAGIVYLKKENGVCSSLSISKEDGIQSNEVKHIVCFGRQIWYSTHNGLYHFDPHKMIRADVKPKTEILSMQVGRMTVDHTIYNIFRYDQSDITVKARCLSYLPGNPTGLRFRLLGYDSTWQSIFNNDQIQYTNLPPHSYTLEVQGINGKKVLSDTERIVFRIRLPFWCTWWFELIDFCVAIIAIAFGVKLYVSSIRRKEKEKTRINKILSEYQMTALRAQINPHFIFNCISSIQIFVLKGDIDTAYNYLQKFSRLLRLVLENSKYNFISLEEELNVITPYIELEQLRIEGGFRYILDIAPGIDTSLITVPYMILQPVIENAIWHGLIHSDKKEKILKLSIELSGPDEMEISIEDNGIGRRKSAGYRSAPKVSMGEAITNQRLSLIDPSGKKIGITDLYDEAGEPAGTLVKISIPLNYETY